MSLLLKKAAGNSKKACKGAGNKAADKAAKKAKHAADRLRKKGQKEYNKGGDFRKWFHRDYKGDLKIPGGKGIKNPDMDLGPAYKQWLDEGKPTPSY